MIRRRLERAPVVNLEKAGIGFGKKGKGPGRFYRFPGKPPSSTTTPLRSNRPR